MITVACIGCSKTKLAVPAPALALYEGTRFRAALRKAWRLKTDYVFILSAKHGLVPEDAFIEPYDESLADKTEEARVAWGRRVAEQLLNAPYPPGDFEVVVLAEDLYADPLRPYLPDAEYPLTGMSEEEQEAWLAS